MFGTLENDKLGESVEWAKRRVANARKELVEFVTTSDPDVLISKRVSDLTMTLSECEGRHHALAVAEYAAQDGRDPFLAVAAEVKRGADDTWSGRGNDARRAYFDGVLEVMRDLPTIR